MKVNGVIVIENYITEQEEQELLKLVDRPGGDRRGKNGPNRMFRFGDFRKDEDLIIDQKAKEHGYSGVRRSYGAMNDGIDYSQKQVPEILQRLGERLHKDGWLDKVPPCYIINKYKKETGIAKHIDHFSNGPVIPVIGLLTGAVMRMIDPATQDHMDFDFPPRALFLLTEEARYELMHSILPVTDLRYAVVFRNLPSKITIPNDPYKDQEEK